MATPASFEFITDLPLAATIDATADVLPIVTNSINTTQKINRNTLLGLASAPVGLTDSQTLTNKILTAPTISSPVLSGTVTGTYTIGGTPTFPASVVTLTGSQTLTNKVLTSPTINTPTITNASITADALTGFSSSTTGTVYGVSVASGVIASAALVGSVNTAAIASSAVDNTKVATGFVVQVVGTPFTSVATGTTTIPFDNTIPQNTEGDQYMSQTITPKSVTNTLIIEVVFFGSNSIGNDIIMALFQDSTANALAATSLFNATATSRNILTLTHSMTAGTTSSTTFKVRAGSNGAATVTFNGSGGTGLYGAITKSYLKITEVKA